MSLSAARLAVCVSFGLFFAGEACAAVDPCRLAAIWPVRGSTLESVEAQIDELGCAKEKSETAHVKSWICGPENAPSELLLAREKGVLGEYVNLVVQDDALSLHDIRRCLHLQTPDQPHFNPVSLVEADQVTVVSPDRKVFTRLTHGSLHYIAGSNSLSDEGLKIVESAFFQIERPGSASGRVEVAGKNIISTPVDEVVQALKQRGSEFVREDSPGGGWYRQIELTAPTGLDGVLSVEIEAGGRHIFSVTYVVRDIPAYEALIAAMEGKYGDSMRVPAKDGKCVHRFWESLANSDSTVIGSYCAGRATIELVNTVAMQQEMAVARKFSEPAPPDISKRRMIDRDNF